MNLKGYCNDCDKFFEPEDISFTLNKEASCPECDADEGDCFEIIDIDKKTQRKE